MRKHPNSWYTRFRIWLTLHAPRVAKLFCMTTVSYRVLYTTSCPLGAVRFRKIYTESGRDGNGPAC